MQGLATADSLVPGTVIDGKYEVKRVLGTGAMGAVVEATHLLRRARVALKFMSQDMADRPGVVERFLNEGVAASRINNEHVVKVLDVSRLPNGQPYLVMEFLDGEDLDSVLTREGAQGLRDVQRSIHFILQVLRGLQVAHHAGIIHRDLKPANCFAITTEEGEQDFVKLVDFGISKVQEPDHEQKLTREGMAMGTPLYVSPEQARDATQVDARSDLYSVATMLYELLVGRTPFQASTLPALFMQLATQTPTPVNQIRADLPPGLAEVVQKGLEKAPADRFQSPQEMAMALAPYADLRSEGVLQKLFSRSRQSSHSPPMRGSSIPVPPYHGTLASAPAVTQFSGKETRGTAPGVVSAGLNTGSRRPGAPAQSTRTLLLFGVPFGILLVLAGGYALFVRKPPVSAPEHGSPALITEEPARTPAATVKPDPTALSLPAPSPLPAPSALAGVPGGAPNPPSTLPSASSAAPPPTPAKPGRKPAAPLAHGAPDAPQTAPETPPPAPPVKPSLKRIGLQD